MRMKMKIIVDYEATIHLIRSNNCMIIRLIRSDLKIKIINLGIRQKVRQPLISLVIIDFKVQIKKIKKNFRAHLKTKKAHLKTKKHQKRNSHKIKQIKLLKLN